MFGAHSGSKVSELLASFDTAAYVTNYLAQNKNLPAKVRKLVIKIIENQDPFAPRLDQGLNVKEVKSFEEIFGDDDIPW